MIPQNQRLHGIILRETTERWVSVLRNIYYFALELSASAMLKMSYCRGSLLKTNTRAAAGPGWLRIPRIP